MADDRKICQNCDHWLTYLTGLGECMEYARRRYDAMARYTGDNFARDWPKRPARDTEATDTCGSWKLRTRA